MPKLSTGLTYVITASGIVTPALARVAHLVEGHGQGHPVAQRHLSGALDGGSVGERIAERNADLGGDAPGALRAQQQLTKAVELG